MVEGRGDYLHSAWKHECCSLPCDCKLRGSLLHGAIVSSLPLFSPLLPTYPYFFFSRGPHWQLLGNQQPMLPLIVLAFALLHGVLCCLCFKLAMVIIIKYGPPPKPIEGLASALVAPTMDTLALPNMAIAKTWYPQT